MTTLKIGDRVALLADFGDYPMPVTPAGSTGKITQITPDFVGVLMDQEFPHLADWENVLQVYTFNDDGDQVPDWSILRGAMPAQKPNRKPFELTDARKVLLAEACRIAAQHSDHLAACGFRVLEEKLLDGDTMTPDAR